MRHAFAASLVLVAMACGPLTSPPEKEMNLARGAIAAARAAGADVYAVPEYQVAVGSMKRSEDAVAQRDYRQALNFALDAREQAETAARAAADGKAAARSEAERQLRDTEAALTEAAARLKTADALRGRRRPVIKSERAVIAGAGQSVQKARAALTAGDFIAARDATRGVADQLRAAIHAIEQASQPPPPRRRQ